MRPYHASMARLASINRSPGGIPKLSVPESPVRPGGLAEDGHDHEKHRVAEQAVSLLDLELLRSIEREFGHAIGPGGLGENLTVEGVGVQRLGSGDRLLIGHDDPVVLEITRVRPPCYVLDAIDPRFKRVLWNRIGMYASVLRAGIVRTGDPVRIETRTGVARPLLRTPKGGCEDGREIARRVLDRCELLPMSEASTS